MLVRLFLRLKWWKFFLFLLVPLNNIFDGALCSFCLFWYMFPCMRVVGCRVLNAHIFHSNFGWGKGRKCQTKGFDLYIVYICYMLNWYISYVNKMFCGNLANWIWITFTTHTHGLWKNSWVSSVTLGVLASKPHLSYSTFSPCVVSFRLYTIGLWYNS